MAEITNIYKSHYSGFSKNEFQYSGSCRNERKFNIGDSVFFSPSKYQGTLYRGRIIGVEVTPDINFDYIYKITIPDEYFEDRFDDPDYKKTYENIECDSIFFTIEEAKEKAIQNYEYYAKKEREDIERFFNQFKKK